MSLPLMGVRVLDLSRYLPGPFSTQLLADFGAEVIKVEDPKGGELGRSLPPLVGEQSVRFYTVNRNKKSITLDLKQAEGQAVFKRLVANSDVVIQPFRAGVMEKMGLGYEELKKVNPRIICCSLTGYGLTGPLAQAAGHEINFMGLSGVIDLNRTGSQAPVMSGAPGVDVGGGSLYAVVAILLALLAREKTGEGQLCDIAILDGAIANLAYTMGEWSGGGKDQLQEKNLQAGDYAFYNIYQTRDNKYISLAAVEKKFWATFCQKMGWPEYIPVQWDASCQPEIEAAIRKAMLTRTRDEWVEFFAADDVCLTPVLALEEMCEHPQVVARENVIKIDNFKGAVATMLLPGMPVKLSRTPARVELVFPQLGEHTEEVLLAAQYSTAEIKKLREDGVI